MYTEGEQLAILKLLAEAHLDNSVMYRREYESLKARIQERERKQAEAYLENVLDRWAMRRTSFPVNGNDHLPTKS